MVRAPLKVVPSASRDEVAGWLGDVLKGRVRAPAERGRANKAVEALLAAELGVMTRQARIVTGHTSARKMLEVDGLTATEITPRLNGES